MCVCGVCVCACVRACVHACEGRVGEGGEREIEGEGILQSRSTHRGETDGGISKCCQSTEHT